MRRKLTEAVGLVMVVALAVACQAVYDCREPHQRVVCEGRYAFCAEAPCTPIPTLDPQTGKIETKTALCECRVANGPSLGDLSCIARAPQGEGRYLVSTFSFDETATHPLMSCPSGTPWASCYDQPCLLDAKDHSKAQCICPIRTDGEYQTLGGSCERTKCGSTLWSAATPGAMKELGMLLARVERLKHVPANSCQ